MEKYFIEIYCHIYYIITEVPQTIWFNIFYFFLGPFGTLPKDLLIMSQVQAIAILQFALQIKSNISGKFRNTDDRSRLAWFAANVVKTLVLHFYQHPGQPEVRVMIFQKTDISVAPGSLGVSRHLTTLSRPISVTIPGTPLAPHYTTGTPSPV